MPATGDERDGGGMGETLLVGGLVLLFVVVVLGLVYVTLLS
ncbi:hypothetical protein [Phytohabitans aurantiacus]|uniref:Uncharacterized protein n=1 Tax=Phytohabitans aurantiacus TaxID=3016789 RepID=A0ABQ5R7R8_9ACTN|nr:hypothetical protein [Phytohabitans aurantiacus]GLI01611.1 hypothetical protein Pa4123_68870 [Phytohabitans aurantiacus]